MEMCWIGSDFLHGKESKEPKEKKKHKWGPKLPKLKSGKSGWCLLILFWSLMATGHISCSLVVTIMTTGHKRVALTVTIVATCHTCIWPQHLVTTSVGSQLATTGHKRWWHSQWSHLITNAGHSQQLAALITTGHKSWPLLCSSVATHGHTCSL